MPTVNNSWRDLNIRKIFLELYFHLVGVLVLILISFTFILFIPSLLFRPIASVLSKILRPDFGNILTPISSIFAQTDTQIYTKTIILVKVTAEGIINYKNCIKIFNEKIIQSKLETGELRYPELQQSITNWAGYKFWKWDSTFNLKNHIKIQSERADLDEELLCGSFCKDKSPWDITLVYPTSSSEEEGEGRTSGNRTIIYFRCHHALSDGFSILFLFQRLLAVQTKSSIISPSTKTKKNFNTKIKYLINIPFTILKLFGELFHNSVCSFAWKISESQKSPEHFYEVGESIPVEIIKKIRRDYGVSFTSVIFSLITGGIREFFLQQKPLHYQHHHQSKLGSFPSMISIPIGIDNRSDQLQNKFSFALVSFPIGESDPSKRLKIIGKYLEDLKESSVPLIGYLFAQLLGSQFNFIGKIINSFKYSPITTTYFPVGNPNWIFDGHQINDFSFCLRASQGEQGVLFAIASMKNQIKITTVANAAVLTKLEVKQLSSFINAEVDSLLKTKD